MPTIEQRPQGAVGTVGKGQAGAPPTAERGELGTLAAPGSVRADEGRHGYRVTARKSGASCTGFLGELEALPEAGDGQIPCLTSMSLTAKAPLPL